MRIRLAAALVSCAAAAFAAAPWRRVDPSSYKEAKANFASPPPEYAMTLWWFWNSAMAESDIRRDLDEMRSHGVRSVLIWSYKGLAIEYLSEEWFRRVRYAVEEAARRDMRVWLMDEGSYPSGFMGGRISRDFPELRMQILAPGDPPTPEFRTSSTRYVHAPGFAKDTKWSLFDALNPDATKVFLDGVHEKYREALGSHLGRTVLGIMGDEPSFPGVPWTPALPEAFEARKSYDIRERANELFQKDSDRARRIRADYWDVWSDLYRDNFFKPQAEWCERYDMDYLVHLCGEEDMKMLLRLNGDFFKCMRYVQMPGVDAIWRQIWPGVTADYAKLGSSAAHLNGMPRSFTEANAVYGRGMSLEQAKWVMDHHFVRGINQYQTMLYLSSREEFRPYFHPPDWNGSPQWPHFPLLAEYSNRASYLLSIGRPAAEIAVYYPTTSGWLGDFEADRSALAIAKDLLERQRDFDFIDEDGLRTGVEVKSGALENRSGQRYRAVVVPSVTVLSVAVLDRLKSFAVSGGRVVFMGRKPAMMNDGSFLAAAAFRDDLGWATVEPSGMFTERVLAALPKPDVVLAPAAPAVKYVRRALSDAEVYFFFNESDKEATLDVRVRGRGGAELWDAAARTVEAVRTARDGDYARLQMSLQPFQTRFVVVGAVARGAAAPAGRAWRSALMSADGWLKPWPDRGFSGAVSYKTAFRIPDGAAGRQLLLDLGTVRYSASVKLNGRDLGARAWRPFRWDISKAVRPGENTLEVEVRNTAANELSGNPARLKEVEGKGWLVNSYFRIYSKFDDEMVPSGLEGPVRLLWR